jgi:hypothetical protein
MATKKPAVKMSATPPPRPLSYEEAMANQNYNNLRQEQEARRAALRATFGETAPVNPAIGLPTLMPIGGLQSMPPAFYDVGRGLPPEIIEEMQRRKDAPTLMPIGGDGTFDRLNPQDRAIMEDALRRRQEASTVQPTMPVANFPVVNNSNITDAQYRGPAPDMQAALRQREIDKQRYNQMLATGIANMNATGVGQITPPVAGQTQPKVQQNFAPSAAQNYTSAPVGQRPIPQMSGISRPSTAMPSRQFGGQPAQFRRLPQQRQAGLSGSPIGRFV